MNAGALPVEGVNGNLKSNFTDVDGGYARV